MINWKRLLIGLALVFVFILGRGAERYGITHGHIACPAIYGYHLDMHSEAKEIRKMFQFPRSDPTVIRIYVEREDTGERMRIKEWSLKPYYDTNPGPIEVDMESLEKRKLYISPSDRTWGSIDSTEASQADFDKAVAEGKDCRWIFDDGPESGNFLCVDPTNSSVTIEEVMESLEMSKPGDSSEKDPSNDISYLDRSYDFGPTGSSCPLTPRLGTHVHPNGGPMVRTLTDIDAQHHYLNQMRALADRQWPGPFQYA